MLYLEDYLEMIEHLPQELRDRFTEMREMDLSVQNNMDTLEKRSRSFFSQCKKGDLQGLQADSEFQNLRKDYYKVLEDADEKVSLATQMHELVERYLRRLDSELFNFKCELEADNNGITEILEKRSLELDGTSTTSTSNQKENRYFGAIASNNHHSHKDNRYRHKPEKRRDSTSGGSSEKRQAVSTNLVPPTPQPVVRPTTPNLGHHSVIPSTPTQPVSYNFPHIGSAGSAIAAAASQAIVATQQMPQGRRTASLKASYEAIHGITGSGPHDLIIGRELVGATHSAIQAVEREGSSFHSQRRHKKKLSAISSHGSSSSTSLPSTSSHNSSQMNSSILDSVGSGLSENGVTVEQTTDGEWTYDPNEPRYCICNQVSYGDMVACDNEHCPFEWFHYPCVGITQSPKGKWYCPKCTASMRRRGNRKN